MDEKKKDRGGVREALRVCAGVGEHSGCEECPSFGRDKCISALIEGAEELVEYYEARIAELEEAAEIFYAGENAKTTDALLRCTGEMPDGCLDCPYEGEENCADVLIEAMGDIFRRFRRLASAEKEAG